MYFPMTRRRFLAQSGKVALATGMGGTLLEACGTSSNTPSGPITLRFGWWSNTPAKDNAMRAWLNDFHKAYPNITVNSEIIAWGDYWDKLKTTTAGGNAYDIIGLSSAYAAPYEDEGALLDLTTFSDYQSAINDLSSGALELCQWNGKAYSLPIGTSVSIMGYNKALLDAAGVPVPDPIKPMSFQDFMAMGKKISKKSVQYALNPTDLFDYDTLVRMEGGSVYDHPVNPTKMTINTPAGIQGLTDYLNIFADGIAPPYAELSNGPWSFDTGALDTGKIAFARVGAWLFSDMQKNPDYGVAPLFKIKEAVVLGSVNSVGIYKDSKNKDAAWTFLKWAVQTQPEITFAKFSDIPADKRAFSQLDTYIHPAKFAPTLQAAFPTFQPMVTTTKDQLSSTLGDIITDMMAGKLTPAQAAVKMEQQGNTVLSASS